MANPNRISWQQLREKNPAAFEQFLEIVMEYVCPMEQDDFIIEEVEGKLFTDGTFPGDHNGIRQMWDGEDWDDVGYDEDDEDEDDDEG